MPAYSEAFARFWQVYPPRNGRRVGKKRAWAQWQRLSPEDQAACQEALAGSSYGQDGYAKDAERFLRDRIWEDLEPVEEDLEQVINQQLYDPHNLTAAQKRQLRTKAIIERVCKGASDD